MISLRRKATIVVPAILGGYYGLRMAMFSPQPSWLPSWAVAPLGVASTTLLMVAAVLAAWLVVDLVRLRLPSKMGRAALWLPMWHIRKTPTGIAIDFDGPFPFRRFIPYQEAVRIAYERIRGTHVGAISEALNHDDPLGYYAYALFDGSTAIFGTHPPSRILERVPNEESRKCGFVNLHSAVKRLGDRTNLFENLHIKQADVRRRIREMRALT